MKGFTATLFAAVYNHIKPAKDVNLHISTFTFCFLTVFFYLYFFKSFYLFFFSLFSNRLLFLFSRLDIHP